MLYEKAFQKGLWEAVRAEKAYAPLLSALLEDYRAVSREGPVSAVRFSEYIIYQETGSRKKYEAAYFARRKRLNTYALMALVYPEEGEHLLQLQDTVWAICDEYTWALPAHIAWRTGRDPGCIDLFSAETGFALSMIRHLLGDRLHEKMKERIDWEINRRIIRPFLYRRFWWEHSNNNWAAVCAGSVGCTFMLSRPRLFSLIRPRIAFTMRRFLSGFSADGICAEGVDYWSYGFGFFTVYARLLREFTHGRKNYFKRPKVKEIAGFYQKISLGGGVTVSFSDGGQRGRYYPGLLNFLREEYPDAIGPLPPESGMIHDHCYRFCLELDCFLYNGLQDGKAALGTMTYYAPKSAWLIRRTTSYGFAAKGGSNDVSHNHNDIGSFIVVSGGRQLLCDLGPGEYVKDYFNDQKRYQYFCTSSRGHSVPVINGQLQGHGAKYHSVSAWKDGVFEIEMTQAYRIPGIESVRRSFCFEEEKILLTDQLSGKVISLKERFITQVKPVVEGNAVRVGSLLMRPMGETGAPEIVQEPFQNHFSQEETVYCIDFDVSGKVFTLELLMSESEG